MSNSVVEKKNTEVVELYYEGWAKGRISVVDECFSDQFVAHGHGGRQTISREKYRQILSKFGETYSNMNIEKEIIFAKDNMVAVAFSGQITHTSTGRRITRFRSVNIYRLENQKIVEFWFGRDELAFYQDLGLVLSDEDIRSRMS